MNQERHRKEIAMNLVKSFSPDEPPGNEIGTGVYDYVIGVYNTWPPDNCNRDKSRVSYAYNVVITYTPARPAQRLLL